MATNSERILLNNERISAVTTVLKALQIVDVGTVTTNTLEPGSEASVVIEQRYDDVAKKTFADFIFNIPKGQDGLQGEQGPQGDQIELRVNSGVIEWKYVNETEWKYLIAGSELITIDASFSSTSTNPIQNKIITEMINTINSGVDYATNTANEAHTKAQSAQTTANGSLQRSGGTMTGAVQFNEEDGECINYYTDFYINRNGGYTLLGTDSINVYVGDPNQTTLIRGSATRPKYNNNDMALYSDIPTFTYDESTKTLNIVTGG